MISLGTERSLAALAQSNLLAKARARPDLVRQVVHKARTDGIRSTLETVRARLDEDVPLGYSAAGVVLEVGEYVTGIQPGQLVATGGAGKANHAEYQAVPALLCTPVPDGVSAEEAAFATIASIGLHALRLAEVQPGAKVAVLGLGLVGQLTARLAQAAGCDVAGIDVAEFPLSVARSTGVFALDERGDDTTLALLEWSRGRGADAVLVAAADKSSAVMRRAPALCRDRATIVVVGDVGLDLDRRPLYERELTIRFARSYGPGRYERSYEDWAVDMPPGYVRWTEGRNQEAVLDLMASGRLAVRDLITHRFPIDDAPAAYELIQTRREPHLGVVLTYPETARPEGPIVLRARSAPAGEPGVGVIGTGAFAGSVLVPALQQAGFSRFVAATSASGLSARRMGERVGFERLVSGGEAVIDDPDVDVVVIAAPHDTHAELTVRAIEAGKAVWCEKPLALSTEELERVEEALAAHPGVLFVGFNRRWSPAVRQVTDHFAGGTGPLVITYRVNAGRLAEGHWTGDRRQGGRLLGEVCHFVDTCAAIAGDVVDANAFGTSAGELLLADDLVLSLRHAGGSLSTISYASGGAPSAAKERIEVMGRGRSAVIDDFKSVSLDGKRKAGGGRDKGNEAMAAAFRRAVISGDPVAYGLDTTAAVLRAAASLGGAGAAAPPNPAP